MHGFGGHISTNLFYTEIGGSLTQFMQDAKGGEESPNLNITLGNNNWTKTMPSSNQKTTNLDISVSRNNQLAKNFEHIVLGNF